MKNDSERGLVGAWARRARMAEGLTVEQAVSRLAAEGTAADASYVRAIESGSKRPRPDADIVAALGRVYRASPPTEPAQTSQPAQSGPDLTALVGALTVQAAGMADLVGELRAERQGRVATEERVDRMQAAIADLTREVRGLVEKMAAWEEGGAPSGGLPPGRGGGLRRRGDPKTHAGAR